MERARRRAAVVLTRQRFKDRASRALIALAFRRQPLKAFAHGLKLMRLVAQGSRASQRQRLHLGTGPTRILP